MSKENINAWTGNFSGLKRPRENGGDSVANFVASKVKKSRENHREIEKRRRERMKQYFTELEKNVPPWQVLHKKPVKVNFLQMTSNYVRSLRGSTSPTFGTAYKQSFLTDEELKNLISQGANGFLFVVSCDTSLVVYVTDTISRALNRSENDWLGTSIFEQIHVGDIQKMRQQLSFQDTSNRILDWKTGILKKEGCQASMRYWNSKRNFICRMKIGNNNNSTALNPLKPTNRLGNENYAVVHCSGSIRNMPKNEVNGNGSQQQNNYCLVATGRVEIFPASSACECKNIPIHTIDISDPNKNSEFVLKLSPDETVVFADERVTNVLGFASHELLTKSIFDFTHVDDFLTLKDNFQHAIRLKNQELTFVCRCKSKYSKWLRMKIVVVAFTNPFSDLLEFIICTCFNAELTEGATTSRSNANETLQNMNNPNQLGNLLNSNAVMQSWNFLTEMHKRNPDLFLPSESSAESDAGLDATPILNDNILMLDEFSFSNFG